MPEKRDSVSFSVRSRAFAFSSFTASSRVTYRDVAMPYISWVNSILPFMCASILFG